MNKPFFRKYAPIFLWKGFTLIELMVVISIIAMLMAVLLPALNKARGAAKQIRAMSDLKQILLAYTCYYTDNEGHLLYGYMPQSVDDTIFKVYDKYSGYTYGAPIVNRYPWRLVPYLENQWRVLFSHAKEVEIPSRSDSQEEAFRKAYALSINPTFGLNSIYVGGHYSPFYKGFIDTGTTAQPNYDKHIVFKAERVRRPSDLIIFTDSKMYSPADVPERGSSDKKGFFYTSPPYANGRQWQVKNEKFEILQRSRMVGLPEGRYTKRTVTGFYDCHVSALKAQELEDMRLWANEAKSKDYDLTD